MWIIETKVVHNYEQIFLCYLFTASLYGGDVSFPPPKKWENKIPSFIKKKGKSWQKVWEMDILSNGIYTSKLMKFTPVLNADMRLVHFLKTI